MILKEQTSTCVWNDRDTKATKPPSVTVPGGRNWTLGGWVGPKTEVEWKTIVSGECQCYDLWIDGSSSSRASAYIKYVGGSGCPSTATSGCTDSAADNYNPSATVDDGSCTYGGSPTPSPSPSLPSLPLPEPKFTKWCLTNQIVPSDPINSEWSQLIRDVRDGKDPYEKNAYMSKLIWIQRGNCPDQPTGIAPSSEPRLVLFAEDLAGKRTLYLIEPNPDNPPELGYIDHKQGNIWYPFHGYRKINEGSLGLEKVLKEEDMNDTLPKMIDDKLREFNFYSANDKGKQKVVFTDEDREEISREFDDLIKKYPEDIAFIRAVVIAKGEDKKTGEPIIRLGSYYNNADIELPFNSQMNGLGKLLDGGIIYFTVINNEGPDYRDFKIVGGDKIPEVEFNDNEKEEIELDNYTHSHDQEMAEMEEPFEEVMKKKEQKGLASLLEKGDVTNDLTKRQKEVLENLKKKGFKLSKPENADIYERVRVNSKEFNESIKAWKPKGK